MRKTAHIELRIAQIISTEKRKEIMNVIVSHQNEFTVGDVLNTLKNNRVDVKMSAVVNVVKSLHYAGFLSEKPGNKGTQKGGRPKNVYKIIPDISVSR